MTHTSQQTIDFCASGRAIVRAEAEAVYALADRISDDFSECCRLILNASGRVIIVGIGKSGHIGKKIAATLASTGTPAFYVHPSEACHGDLGMITRNDVVVMISNSGETAELLHLIPLIQQQSIPIIAMTGNPHSTLAQAAHHHLDVGVEKEAGIHGLAPTSSSTVTLVMGDALAMTLLEARNFTPEDFAFFHPGGSLGRKLTLKVSDLMHAGDEIPQVQPHVTISQALVEITQKRLGMTTVLDNGQLAGVFTDGDLRRSIDQNHDIFSTPISAVMSTHFQHIQESERADTALQHMRQLKITSLIVYDHEQQLCGVLHLHDLVRAGVT